MYLFLLISLLKINKKFKISFTDLVLQLVKLGWGFSFNFYLFYLFSALFQLPKMILNS